MAELMGPTSDFEQQQLDLMQRKGRYAQQQQMNMPSSGQMVGNRFVATNPLNYLAEMLRGYGAKRGEEQATEQLKDLQGKRQTAIADALRNFGEKSQGAPAFEAAGPMQPSGAPLADPLGLDGGKAAPSGGYTVPERKPDLRGAYADLMAAPDVALRNAGMQGIIQMPQLEAARLAKEEERQFRRDEAAATRQARMDELKMRAEDQRASQQERLQAQREMRQMQMDFQRQNQQLIAANRPERQAQIIDTDQGKMRVLSNGQLEPLMDTQGNVISGPKGPQGTLARENEAKQALAAIKQAETLLPKATSSGLGSAVDATAAFFGASTPGAQAASQLKALEGELVSKMPKMSGPQSDKDVALYKQMAGVIGDQTQPVATRQAALATVKEIQQRYAGQQPMPQPGQLPGPRPQNLPQTGRIRFDANGNIIQ